MDHLFAAASLAYYRPRPREEVHAAAMARGANCTACPLYGCGRGPVLPDLRPGTPLTIIGEGPGDQEVEQERPFVGWSGVILEGALLRGGLSRAEASITNATLCQPPPEGYRVLTEFIRAEWRRRVKRAQALGLEPPPEPMLPHDACAPRLQRDLLEARAPTYLAVGALALEQSAKAFGVKAARISMQHGAPVLLPNGGVLMSSYHPAMAKHGRKELMPVILENLERGARVARAGGQVPWRDPPVITDPSPETALAFLRRLRVSRAETAVDIETDGLDIFDAKILCVGFSAFLDRRLETMSIPVRNGDAARSLHWPEHVALPVWTAMREVLDHNPLIFHFGLFDTPKLLVAGLMTDTSRSWTDTQVLHKNTTDSDHEHTLGYAARRYFCVPMWKADIDRKNAAKVTGTELRRYNGCDTSITRLVAEPLRQQVAAWGNTRQNDLDHQLLPVIRNMSLMGLPVDEHRRSAFSGAANWQVQRELYLLKERVGDARFNPRSTAMVQDLIYNTWKLKPPALETVEPVNADDFARANWRKQILAELDYESAESSEDLGSTSAATITAIIKSQELSEQQLKVLQTLLEFRAWDKLRSTYTDNMKVRACDAREYAEVQKRHGEVPRADAVRVLVYDEALADYAEVERLPERPGMSMWYVQFKPGPPTGRLASSPNAQNIPAQGKLNMRKTFRAPPGHCWIGADYEQLEARIYAAVADDQLLLQTVAEGKDIHSMNAATLLAKSLSEVDSWYQKINKGEKAYRKYWRNVAKRFAFLEIYGGSEQKLFEVMSVQRNRDDGRLSFPDLTPDDVKMWHDNWHTLHPETFRFHATCHDEYRRTHCVRVPDLDFRARYFIGGPSQMNAVPNMKIQGFASSIANRALLRIVEALPFRSWSWWTGVNLQVHDFIAGIIPDTREHRARAAKIWEESMFHSFKGVPFPAKAEFGYYWNELDV